MHLFISLSATKIFDVGARVAVEFDVDDWSIGTVVKVTATGYKFDFDYGETNKLIKKDQARMVIVDAPKKIKKPQTFAQVKALKPVKKAAPVKAAPVKAEKPKTPHVVEKAPIGGEKAPALTKTPSAPVQPDVKSDTHEEKILADALGDQTKFTLARIGNDREKALYIGHVWTLANEKFFGGRLKLPVISIMKDMGKNMRALGGWRASTRELKLTPRLFNATQAHVVATIVHEQCHQAVSEIDHAEENNGGHGPIWSAYMRHCGLTPSRYCTDDIRDFMSVAERSEHDRKVAERKSATDAQTQSRVYPHRMMPAQFYSTKTNSWVKGLIVDRANVKGSSWMFITTPRADKWLEVGVQMFYSLPKEEAENYMTEAFRNAATLIIEQTTAKMGRRSKLRLRF